jgi:hypothetical protein
MSLPGGIMSEQGESAEEIVRQVMAIMTRRTEVYDEAAANMNQMIEIMRLLHEHIDAVAPSGTWLLGKNSTFQFELTQRGWTVNAHHEITSYCYRDRMITYSTDVITTAVSNHEETEQWLSECYRSFIVLLTRELTDLKKTIAERESGLNKSKGALASLRELLTTAP